MRSSVSLTLSVFAMLCLSFLASGCGCVSGSGARAQGSCCALWPTFRARGYESGLAYRAGAIPAYKLVIELRPLSERERADFLQGFRTAFDEVHDSTAGKEYATILRQSLEGGFYDEAVQQGRKYVSGESTDARIQRLISGSVGLSPGSSLGWKAGYIVGFAREMASQGPGFEESFYRQAETKYNALRGPLGV